MNDELLRQEIESIYSVSSSEPSARIALTRVVQLLAEARPTWHWIGIYILIDVDTLELGPYHGEPTEHTRIEVGHGVCGTAVAEGKNQIVDDVRALDNYISCSMNTRSEIVVLVKHNQEVVGQFDIDSDIKANFSAEDEHLLEELAKLLAPLVSRLKNEMRQSPVNPVQ